MLWFILILIVMLTNFCTDSPGFYALNVTSVGLNELVIGVDTQTLQEMNES